METAEKEYEILENIYNNNTQVKQRDLAEIVGMSLGMTNAILKRLAEKGWLTVRKVNNRNIRYAVSPEGVDVIARRSYRYFKRTIKNVVFYREEIEHLIKEIKKKGFIGIVLIGQSDLGFIVEHSCRKYSIEYIKNEQKINEKIYYLYSEKYIPDIKDGKTEDSNKGFLQSIFL